MYTGGMRHSVSAGISERGVALALVLVVAVLLSITVMAVLQTVGLRFFSGESQRHRDATFYTSEAGIQLALSKLTNRLPPFADQTLAGWPVNTAKTDTITLFGDDTDPANDRVVTITVTRIAPGPGPKQFSIDASTEIPIGGS